MSSMAQSIHALLMGQPGLTFRHGKWRGLWYVYRRLLEISREPRAD